MGFSGVGFTELLLLCVIIVLLFGTKKLSTLGSDLGSAIRGFRQAMSDGNQPQRNQKAPSKPQANLPHSQATYTVDQSSGAPHSQATYTVDQSSGAPHSQTTYTVDQSSGATKENAHPSSQD